MIKFSLKLRGSLFNILVPSKIVFVIRNFFSPFCFKKFKEILVYKARLLSGRDYLNPNIELIVDDILEKNQSQKLLEFLESWLKNKINITLKSLIDLKNLKEKNSSMKALAYQLYENNGVLKRDQVLQYLKDLGQNERKILRDLGVKFGRYHIFLFKLIKPEPVTIRTLLWKNYHQKYPLIETLMSKLLPLIYMFYIYKFSSG